MYQTADLPALQRQLLADVASGRLRFLRWSWSGSMSLDRHYWAPRSRVKLRVDHAHAGGTFAFLRVSGVDLSFSAGSGFDLDRVATAIATGSDPGTRPATLWRC